MKIKTQHVLHMAALFGLAPPAGAVGIDLLIHATPALRAYRAEIYGTLVFMYALAFAMFCVFIHKLRHPLATWSKKADIDYSLQYMTYRRYGKNVIIPRTRLILESQETEDDEFPTEIETPEA